MKYKALFLDVDGTLMPNEIEALPSSRVTSAIAKIQDQIHVSIVTSRPLRLALPIMDHLNLSGPCVINGGTQIYDPVRKLVIKEKVLEPSSAKKAIEICLTYSQEVFANSGKQRIKCEKGMNIPKRLQNIYIPDILDQDTALVLEELNLIENISAHKMPSWTKGFMSIDITHSNASKLHGITEVANLLKINTHEMIGVGDSYNDFPLLMACGLKIAMGNAVPELKAIADFVAPGVEEDGVVTVVEKFILNS